MSAPGNCERAAPSPAFPAGCVLPAAAPSAATSSVKVLAEPAVVAHCQEHATQAAR
ncbi:hypothetical protein [Streptomyces sp. SAJ15]|uniref:hypothetical protein n=1 Tax=Streptomyces sp. SAJ15 TaxID=2011095 RepID=UPI0016430780|nr:hypothetical protein [Streptomyces sp. SAJ15]